MTSTDVTSLTSLARAEVRALSIYAPDQTPCTIDVSDNINLWGMPPAAERALREAPPERVTRYPSPYAGPLREALVRYAGVSGASVVTGCGSDDVLDAVMRAFGAPGDRIAYSAPTFSMIPTFARINGLEPVAVPLHADFDVDPERLVETGAKLVYLCAPNNPTATTISRAAVEHVVERAAGIVVLDEAYAEFASATHMDLVARHERLLVTRTFSKAFGLAGLRVGYGIASPELVALVERARGPYKVNALAECAALAALGDGPDALGWMRSHAVLAKGSRARLTAGLAALGLPPLDSDANFVFVPTARAASLARRLRERGILVRALANLPRDVEVLRAANGEALRIGVGPWEMMQAVLDALAAALDDARGETRR
jgi:histidinol-phosphate aminotransferase